MDYFVKEKVVAAPPDLHMHNNLITRHAVHWYGTCPTNSFSAQPTWGIPNVPGLPFQPKACTVYEIEI